MLSMRNKYDLILGRALLCKLNKCHKIMMLLNGGGDLSVGAN